MSIVSSDGSIKKKKKMILRPKHKCDACAPCDFIPRFKNYLISLGARAHTQGKFIPEQICLLFKGIMEIYELYWESLVFRHTVERFFLITWQINSILSHFKEGQHFPISQKFVIDFLFLRRRLQNLMGIQGKLNLKLEYSKSFKPYFNF